MRLTLLTPFLDSRGGFEHKIYRIARHFDATIHCLRYEPENTYDYFRDVNVETPKGGFLRDVETRLIKPFHTARYFYNLKLEGYDLVNAHLEPSEFARRRNSPMIWYCYTPYRSAFDLYDWKMKRSGLPQKLALACASAAFRQIEFGVVPRIEHIFTNSLNCQGRIKRYLGRDAEVLYGGIDARAFKSREPEGYFFYPSRITPEKDFEYAIEAFRIFSSRVKGWRLVIGGTLSRLPESRQYLEKLRAMCGDSISIETDMSEERKRDLYSRCHAVLYSPVDEDFGLVPLEGMASSRPCIAKNEGGPRETIVEGVDGFLVNSPQEMAERMEFLSRNPEVSIAMGKAGRKKVEERFTWERFLKRFGEKANEVINDSAMPRR
jgi:glycosyltransferase involved in cell wall biosynthesis